MAKIQQNESDVTLDKKTVKALKAAQVALMCFTPFVIYYLFFHKGYHAAFIFVVILMVAIRAPGIFINKRLTKSILIQGALIGSYFIFGMIYQSILVVELLPAFINLTLFSMFGYSLLKPPSVVASIAASQSGKPLGDEELKYCWNVTLIWTLFFILDLALIVYVALYMSMLDWAILTGAINYVIMGSIFGGEYIYRKFKFRNSSPA